MRRWLLLCLAAVISIATLPALAIAAPQEDIAPITRDAIMATASQMALSSWVSPVTVYANQSAWPVRWGTFYAGQTYVGMAYTQQNPQEDWPTFSANMRNHVGTPGVDQGTDCSGFASIAWGIPRQTTSTFISNGYAYKLSSLSSLLPGDALLRPSYHIGLVAQRLDSGSYQVLEQTDPHALRTEWSYSYASTYAPVRRNGIVSTTATPVPTAPPPAPPAPPSSTPLGSFFVQYFANQTLSGNPTFTRNEAYPLSHDWGAGGPGNGVPNDHFSARASGRFNFPAGSFTFNVAPDDGVRVWVDGKLIVDHWYSQSSISYRYEQYLTAGYHTIGVVYYEDSGNALLNLRWWQTRTCSSGQFLGEYFANNYLAGAPGLRTCEASINHAWSAGPGSPIPGTDFSTRWEGTYTFAARNYTFVARADDGIRVWVDNALIIDQWKVQAPTEYRATRYMSAGSHRVVVSYFQHLGGAVAQVSWQ